MGRDDVAASAAYQPEPTAVAAARRFVRDTLQQWIVTGAAADGHGLVDDAVLLTSELVTNAVVHAGTPVQVVCRLAGDEVEVVVTDGDPSGLVIEPRRDEQDAAERTSGRGLLLPAALASAWGVTYGRAAKAVWFRLGLSGQGTADAGAGDGRAGGGPNGAISDGAALVAALRHAPMARPRAQAAGAARAAVNGVRGAPPAGGAPAAGGSGYDEMLIAAVQATRDAVAADAVYTMMIDEDGELRLRAALGAMPPDGGPADASPAGRTAQQGPTSAPGNGTAPPSVVTAPLVVDGRVIGLLSAASVASGRFGDDDAARLQRLADRWGPPLERARLSELERRRRGRIGALAEARALLGTRLSRDEVLALAGQVAVPRLAAWCAVLLAEEGTLRPVFARHAAGGLDGVLAGMLERVCAGAAAPQDQLPGAQPAGAGAAWRWQLAEADGWQGPAGAELLAEDDAWCFPFAPHGARGALVIGHRRRERLPREVAELACDLACRVGFALEGVASNLVSRNG